MLNATQHAQEGHEQKPAHTTDKEGKYKLLNTKKRNKENTFSRNKRNAGGYLQATRKTGFINKR